MNKLLLFVFTVLLAATLPARTAAQQRIKISDGVYLTNYGSVSVIEDENQQMTISIEIAGKRNSEGQMVYNVLCGNQVVREITKGSLKAAIGSLLSAAGLGNAAWLTGPIINRIYDYACEYYGDK